MTAPTSHPSVEEITCVIIRCAACGGAASNDLEEAIHWPSVDEAYDWLSQGVGEYGECWEIGEDRATWVCPRCVAMSACDRDGGHEWSGWKVYGERATRYCKQCTGAEKRAVIVPEGIAL